MVQIVEMTYDEKVAMYMKQPKKKLVEMLIQCNLHLEHHTKQLQIHNVVGRSEQLVCDYKYHNRDITNNGDCTKCKSHKWR